MAAHQTLIISLASLFAVQASASPIVYVVNSSQQFGTVDLGSGIFHQIGSLGTDAQSGLVPTPNGSLLTLALSGNLNSIDPVSGVTSLIGPTGLADCMSPVSPCGLRSAADLGELGGTVYATDFSNNLYTVNTATGIATLIGPTGIPAFTANPNIPNPDGTFNIVDYTLFGAGGILYATFDVATIDFSSFTITPVVPPNLYQINPGTGFATLTAPTALSLSAAVNVDGTVYAFNAALNQVVTLDLTNGQTSFVSNLEPAAGLILGASPVPLGAPPVPEPGSISLVGVGVAILVVCRRYRSEFMS